MVDMVVARLLSGQGAESPGVATSRGPSLGVAIGGPTVSSAHGRFLSLLLLC